MRNRIVALPALTVLLALVTFAMVATGADKDKDKDKDKDDPKTTTATLSIVCSGGGCDAASGPFCCRHDRTAYKKAFEKVMGVTKVEFDADTRQVVIEYEKGILNLTELAEAAKKLKTDLLL